MTHALIVDDDEMVRRLVEEIVSRLGWTFDSASNGYEALDCIGRTRPDVVISDIGMPGMDGIELLQTIKGDRHPSQIPVVLMSALDRESEGRAAGCDAFIAKPFTIEILEQTLAQVLP